MTKTYLSFLILACLATLAFYSTPTMACSCIKTTAHRAYCTSDYVVLVHILRKSLNGETFFYEIDIKESYKMAPEASKLLESGIITSGSCGGTLCCTEFQVGKMYVISGPGTHFGLCSYAQEYGTLSSNEKALLLGEYEKICDIVTYRTHRGYIFPSIDVSDVAKLKELNITI